MITTRIRLLGTAIAALGITAVLPAQSDTSDTAPLPPVAGLNIQFGAAGLDSRAFNTQLALRGRGQLERQVYTAGVESWVRWGHVMLLSNSQTYVQTRTRATNYTTEMSGLQGSLNIGIPVILMKRTLIYPMAGLGLSSTTVGLRRNGDVNFNSDFRDISSVGGRNIDITARRFQGHLGAGFDQVFRPPWPRIYATVGLRAGYTVPIGDTRWRSGPEMVNGAPEIGLRGAYARLTIGGVMLKRRYATVSMIGTLLPFIGR
jgi:opacity protein-like surface antigen